MCDCRCRSFTISNMIHFICMWQTLVTLSYYERKRRRSDSVLTNPLYQQKIRKPMDNTQMPPKTSITQRLRTNLRRSVGVGGITCNYLKKQYEHHHMSIYDQICRTFSLCITFRRVFKLVTTLIGPVAFYECIYGPTMHEFASNATYKIQPFEPLSKLLASFLHETTVGYVHRFITCSSALWQSTKCILLYL